MRRIFIYECRRLLLNKFFFGFILIILFYGWQVLNSVTILGVSHTAPFSPWSFGDYLCRMIPFLWAGALFFLTFFTSPKAQRVAVLTDATQIERRRYTFARCSAALVGTGMLALTCLAEAAVFFGKYFKWYGWGELLVPVILILVPSLMFALGSGWFLGRVKSWLIYMWMLIPFLCGILPLPEILGILDGSFFTQYPLTLGILDPKFTVPTAVIIVQCTLFVSGVVLLLFQGGSSFHFLRKKRTSQSLTY